MRPATAMMGLLGILLLVAGIAASVATMPSPYFGVVGIGTSAIGLGLVAMALDQLRAARRVHRRDSGD